MLRSLLPAGVTLMAKCSGAIAADNVEPLTLIANELITNAAKHAFVGRVSGEIILGYQEEGAGWRLWVHDNGVGRSSAALSTSASFGNQLIEILAAQLNAELVYVLEGGMKAEVVYGLKPLS
jgi:two-component sensor histidine kinase